MYKALCAVPHLGTFVTILTSPLGVQIEGSLRCQCQPAQDGMEVWVVVSVMISQSTPWPWYVTSFFSSFLHLLFYFFFLKKNKSCRKSFYRSQFLHHRTHSCHLLG